jgi:hypothetical protein
VKIELKDPEKVIKKRIIKKKVGKKQEVTGRVTIQKKDEENKSQKKNNRRVWKKIPDRK